MLRTDQIFKLERPDIVSLQSAYESMQWHLTRDNVIPEHIEKDLVDGCKLLKRLLANVK